MHLATLRELTTARILRLLQDVRNIKKNLEFMDDWGP